MVIEKWSPVTGEKLGEFPITSGEDVEAAVARARAAAPGWRETALERRLDILMKAKAIIIDEGSEIARKISEDTGKPLVDSLMTELMQVPLFLDYYAKTAKKVLSRRRVRTPILFPGKASYIEHYPVGVVAVISPWNFPFQLAVVPMFSALIAGNCVLLKPSEVTPITGMLIDELVSRLDLPEGVCQVLHGDGSTGAALTRADVDKIFFTGSVATGKKVMKAAAEKPIPVELELGGKDAMIVCHDAPLKRAAKAAVWGGLINCGQMCTSVERLFVVESIYEAFKRELDREVAKIKVGGPDEDADMGPITFPPQLETIERHVKDAIEKGATLLRGGKRIERDGQFYEPTVIEGIEPGMEIYDEETFGPVLPIIKVRDEEEALRMANQHKYGLTGSVWTRDRKRGLELASRMECGQAMVNDVVLSVGNPVLPFGGVKASGFGRYHGPEGLLSFTHQKAIMVERAILESEPFWFPYRGKLPTMQKIFTHLLEGNLPGAVVNLLKLRG
jgi:acyl-CoA reductase-like NAD-dependent aldehyde dehydrogenase